MMPATITRPDVAAWVMRERRLAVARKVLDACAAENIPAIPVKGIVTSALLYDDPTERPMFDVDVRILPEDHSHAVALARKKNWHVRASSRVYKNQTLLIDDVEVDIETTVGPPHLCALRVADVISRARRSEVLGFPALIPNFVDHVVLLTVNAFKDKLSLARPWAIADLERVAMRAEFDTGTLADAFRDARVATIAWIVADWLASRGASRWANMRDMLEPIERVRYARLLHAFTNRPEGLAMRVLARLGSDSRRDRICAVSMMLLWQTEQTLQRA